MWPEEVERTRQRRLRTWLARWSLVGLYTAGGAVLAPIATVLLLAIRWTLCAGDVDGAWLPRELGALADVYTYFGVGGAFVLGAIGWMLGTLHESLRAASLTDSLTGPWNRRWLEAHLAKEVLAIGRHPRALSLVLIDVDHLKTRNDRLGHDAGDHVLRWLAESLRTSCRRTDAAARWGGDEFAILAVDTDAVAASVLAERVRADLIRRGFAHSKQDTPTVSIGIADLDGCATNSPGLLFRAADTALRRAKSTGRNRIVVLSERGAP